MVLADISMIQSIDSNSSLYNSNFLSNVQRNFGSTENSKNCLVVSSLGHSGYKLTREITLSIKVENNEFVVLYEPLGIYEYSDKLDSLIKDVKSYIVDLYDELVTSKDSDLSADLIKQKRLLKQLVSK